MVRELVFRASWKEGPRESCCRHVGDGAESPWDCRKRPINPPTISGRRFGRLGAWKMNPSQKNRRRGCGGGSRLDKSRRFSNASEPVA